jgi:predicted house-cleaning noncanonical NTP pyrophosphatase (MazG superfamily)
MGGVKVDKILTAEERADKGAMVNALEKRLFQSELKDAQEETLKDFLAAKQQLSNADILTVIRLMMSTPEYQVC